MSSIRLEGEKDLFKRLKKFAKQSTRKTLVLGAQRRAFRKSGMITIARNNTPVGDSAHFSDRGGKTGRLYLPGNLRESIGLITGKSRKYPNIQLGYRAGRNRRNDGWYGKFVHEGEGRGNRRKHPALDRAFEFAGGRLEKLFGDELKKGMERRKRKHGFR